MPRLFFAIKTPPNLKDKLVTLQSLLQTEFRGFDLVPKFKPESLTNSHCTVRFLGNVERSSMAEIQSATHDAFEAARIPSFECKLSACDVFPNRHHARVFWIGLIPTEPFQAIEHLIAAGLKATGMPFERVHSFYPHLTLFRFREPYRFSQDFMFPDLTEESPVATISEAFLIESKTLSEGPEHTIRATFKLFK